MKFLKIVLLFLAALVLVFFLGGYLLPKTAQVERSVVLAKGVDAVFPYVNSLENFQTWSPWLDLDPNMKVVFSGPKEGVGATMAWTTETPNFSNGQQKIIASEWNKKVISELSYGGQLGSESEFELVPVDGGTQLIWRFKTVFGQNPVERYVGWALEKGMGGQFENGLAKLKHVLESQAQIITEEVQYQVGETVLTGYFAYPEGQKNLPGVLIVHEWWGHNDYVRQRAEMLAQLGYVAFALDMYGDGKIADHPKEANAFMMEVLNSADTAKTRFEAALGLLKNHSAVQENKLAAIGYCFGGSVVMSMARSGMFDLNGVVSYHGGLQGLAPINVDSTDTRFLIFNGAADPMVTEDAKASFKEEMDKAKLQYQFFDYPGALHGFTNPAADEKGEKYGMPLKYDPIADQDSWHKTQVFFKEIF